jgi:Domain of unknown function (DUF4266)
MTMNRQLETFLATAYSLRPIASRSVAALAAMLALAGCGNIEPWVKPYEREALADPIMSFDANPISTSYMHHVFEAREGARGALGSAGGGCGCN